MAEQRAYDPPAELVRVTENIARLNPGQKLIYDQILASVLRSDSQGRPQGRHFFVYGPGGTGKLFTWNTLAASCRGGSLIVLCITSSGIASLILTSSWTSYSMFGISVEIYKNLVLTIKKNSLKGELLRKTRLIIWDEVPMQHRFTLEAIDRTLRDFMN